MDQHYFSHFRPAVSQAGRVGSVVFRCWLKLKSPAESLFVEAHREESRGRRPRTLTFRLVFFHQRLLCSRSRFCSLSDSKSYVDISTWRSTRCCWLWELGGPCIRYSSVLDIPNVEVTHVCVGVAFAHFVVVADVVFGVAVVVFRPLLLPLCCYDRCCCPAHLMVNCRHCGCVVMIVVIS